MTANHESNATSLALPPALADVALVDAATCAAAGAMSVSWWGPSSFRVEPNIHNSWS